MPVRACSRLVFSSLPLFLAACSYLPGPDHRAVTMDAIEEVVVRYQPVVDVSCPAPLVDEAEVRDRRETLRLLESISAQISTPRDTTPPVQTVVRRIQQSCPPPVSVLTDVKEVDGRIIIGETEWIYLSPPGHHYKARVDSGAAISSLSAREITEFERNGKPWVRFMLQHDDEVTAPLPVEARVVRYIRIRQASANGVERRPVIRLRVNLGASLQQDAEFSLTDRSEMTYPILLGRGFLRDVTLIDVGKQFLHSKFQPLPVQENPQ